jgi:16S rRNA (guanine527-N7)-methyltransferase
MNSLPLLSEHFPKLSSAKLETLAAHAALFREWNAKINLVSRKDMDHFEEHHLLHSLAVAKVCSFPAGCRVLDVGTGGGLPGLPLAILFPEVNFYLLDATRKKILAVEDMAQKLGLRNVTCVNKRAEQLESKWDFILGRAVAALPVFLGWIHKNLNSGGSADRPHGVLYWKGSLYQEELGTLGVKPFKVTDLGSLLGRAYFTEKFIVHLRTRSLKKIHYLPAMDPS